MRKRGILLRKAIMVILGAMLLTGCGNNGKASVKETESATNISSELQTEAKKLEPLYLEKKLYSENSEIEPSKYNGLVFERKSETDETGRDYMAFYLEDMSVKFMVRDSGEYYYLIQKGEKTGEFSCAGSSTGDSGLATFVHYSDITEDGKNEIVIIYAYDTETGNARYGLIVIDPETMEEIQVFSKYGTNFTKEQADVINGVYEEWKKDYPDYFEGWNKIKGDDELNPSVKNEESEHFNLQFATYAEGDRITVNFLQYNLLGGYRAEGNAKMKYEDGKFVIDVVSFEVDD